MRSAPLHFLAAAAVAFSSPVAFSLTMDELLNGIRSGKAGVNFRYRYEYVDQDGFDSNANASTLLGRLTWNSESVQGLTFGLQADYIALIGEERYNSTENGRARFPVVADPEGFDLNLAFVKYQRDALTLTAGRQRITHADQRFIGGVAWRQNEQTYDALRAEYKLSETFSVDYAYVWNVNRIFGPNDGAQPSDWRGDTHLLTAYFKPAEGHQLQAFAYLLDFENDNGPANSTETYGLSYKGQLGKLALDATWATQSDYKRSPLSYDADFLAVNAAFRLAPVTLSAGYQLLGSDGGRVGFRTPLATLHKFQGFADLFLGTPATGIEDFHIGVGGAVGKVQLKATWHDFRADDGGADYGTEVNLIANYPINDRLKAQLKFADYSADEFGRDTMRVWASLMFKL